MNETLIDAATAPCGAGASPRMVWIQTIPGGTPPRKAIDFATQRNAAEDANPHAQVLPRHGNFALCAVCGESRTYGARTRKGLNPGYTGVTPFFQSIHDAASISGKTCDGDKPEPITRKGKWRGSERERWCESTSWVARNGGTRTTAGAFSAMVIMASVLWIK